MNKYRLLSLSIPAAVLLSACGGTGQDDGSASSFDKSYSGVAIDGYVARGLVFLDSNNNGTRDSWEAFAFTDNEGYFSYNPNTDTNYCASNATAEQAQYCLRTNTDYDEVVIRIDGGYDVLTGEPFAGQLSRRIQPSDSSETENTLLSPVSTLLSGLGSETERTEVLTNLGMESSDLDVDYLDNDSVINSELLNINLKIHKVVSVLEDRITDTYSEIGEDFGTPNDASNSVYRALANQMLESGGSLDDTLSNQTLLIAALDSAEEDMRTVYENKEFTLPADMGSSENPDQFQRIASVASSIPNVVNVLIDPEDTSPDVNTIAGGVRALEVVVDKTLREQNTSTDLDNAIEFFNNTDTTLVDALVSGLSSDSFDIPSLVNNDFTGTDFDSEEEINDAASLGNDVEAFTQIGGLQLRVSELFLGSFPNDLEDKEVELYFQGASTDLSGAFTACVKFIDGANADGSLGEGNTRGELVEGFWSLLGAAEGDINSFSLLLTITFLETTYQAIMKPAGMDVVQDVTYELLRFDNDGDIRSWHSEAGLVEIGTIPTTNAECEERLPSRVGL